MKLNNYKIILVSDGRTDLREYSLNAIILGLVAFALIAFVSAGFFFFSRQDTDREYSQKLKELQTDNSRLIDLIREHDAEMEVLQKRLNDVIERDNNLRELVKLPEIHEDVRKVGVGGEIKRGEKSLEYLLPESGKDISLKSRSKHIETLHRMLNLTQLSYSEISDIIQSDVHRYRSYPAIHPLMTGNVKLSSDYGRRRDPFDGRIQFHTGQDFSARTGTAVYATADGVVRESKYFGTFGNYIEIDHGYDYITIYGHLSKRKVKPGDKVVRGQLIGKVGNTGKSTASHLHYEVRYRHKHIDPSGFYIGQPQD